MGELTCSVRKEEVTRCEFVSGACSLSFRFRLQFGQLLYRDGNLEKKHSTSDVLTYVESACDCGVDCHILNIAHMRGREVGREVVKQLANQIVRVCQVHEQIIRLG